MKSLVHNGVLVPEVPPATGLKLKIRGKEVVLNALQEQMAMAFAQKYGTPYVEDPVFVRNFLRDFSKALGIKPPLKPGEVDFAPAIARVEEERQRKAAMTKEERKALAAQRKARREELKEKYGYALVDGERVEIANYTVEPSCIFMGRGKHPLRGRWKQGPRHEDIILNLSPDAPRPPGKWKAIVWEPNSLWVAKWRDKLSGKMKYVWLSDTAPIKQNREAQKFELAHKLASCVERVRKHIREGMASPDPRRRQIATACYLIDVLSLRVGDEKDPGEADTVGATTLRPEHVTIHSDGKVEFRFLGKDSVLWHKTVHLPPDVVEQLRQLIANARAPNTRSNKRHPTRVKPQIFPDVRSRNVNAFLNEAMEGLTAKVFRTFHASTAVRNYLNKAKVTEEDPEYLKRYHAKMANLQAAIVCNHTKQPPKNWKERLARFRERQKRAEERIAKTRALLEKRKTRLKELLAKQKAAIQRAKERQKKRKGKKKTASAPKKKPYARSIEAARRGIKTAQARLQRALAARDKLNIQITIAKKTRTWNLGTSLKSYVDPRIFRDWGRRVGYDWKRYYPKTLQRKFAWIDSEPLTSQIPSEASASHAASDESAASATGAAGGSEPPSST